MELNTLQSKLEENFRKFKGNIALEDERRTLTYAEVDKKSNYLSNWLAAKGMGKGTFIGILLDDRMELISTIVGIIKAGCVFIPLDPAYPDNRVEIMIETTGIGLVIIDKVNDERFGAYNGEKTQEVEFVRIDELYSNGEARWFDEKSRVQYNPGDKIYVYFTSGTTGTPKAIVGKNNSLIHFINWEINTFNIDETFRFSQLTTPGFDVFLRDILVPLCAGAAICIPDYQTVLLDSERLVSWIADKRIHLIHCVPSLFRLFNAHSPGKNEKFKDLKYILFAGERVNPTELKKWYETNGEQTQLVNLYGPTETTLAKVFHLIKKSDADKKVIPIGKPIDGARVIILDQNMEICDELVVGELYIRTPYRSFGYYNDAELNRQKFIPNPFSSNPDDIIYKTGDLGRMLPDGNIELTGRVDRQVKIRGIRIELEEIETLMLMHPGVKEAAVIKKQEENDNNSLFAFFVPDENYTGGEESLTNAVKKNLFNELPHYMVPNWIVEIEEMPKKPNLKVDFDALLQLLQSKDEEYVPPRDNIEKKLVEIWSEILGREKVGVTDNFMKLGGNSLSIMSLLSKIYKEFEVRIPLGEIFAAAAVEKQAALIREAQTDKYASIAPSENKDYYAFSSAQKRLYVLYQMDVKSTEYNLPEVTVLMGRLDTDRFEDVIEKLIHRHESLRTSFEMVEEEPVQRIHHKVGFKIEYYDASQVGVEESEGTRGPAPLSKPAARSPQPAAALISSFIRPFDLSHPPLMRVGLVKLEEEKHLFMYDMHHIITDGTSQVLLKNEFMALYAGKELPPLKIRYRDYSQWQDREKQKQAVKKQEEYWLKEFGGDIPVLNLPGDYVRPGIHHFEGSTVNFELGSENIEELRSLALEEEVTLYMVLLTIYILFLGKLSGQEEIVVGTPVAGRTHEDLQSIIGMFVNTLALKTGPLGEKTLRVFLGEIKEKTLNAFENQEYQFEDLVNQLTLSRDVSRNPLFDVMFVFQNIDPVVGTLLETTIPVPGLKLLPWQHQKNTSKFDLTLRIIESEGKLNVEFEYCTKLFKKETIERFITYFKNTAAEVLKGRKRKIAHMEIISGEEKKEILFVINDTTAAYPHEKTIHRLFAEQVEKKPGKIALVGQKEKDGETVQITYRQLHVACDQLAQRLREKGVRPDAIAAVMIERSIELIIAIFAILKAGGGYLPIDPDYPEERIKYMLADSNVGVLLTTPKLQVKVKAEENSRQPRQLSLQLIDIETELASTFEPSLLTLTSTSTCQVSPANLAYIIYTSGTTGRPKGALIEHRNVVRLLFNDKFQFDFNGEDVWTLFHSCCFDFSVWEIYGALLYGGELVVISGMVARDPGKFLAILKQKKVTILNQTPSAFYNLINEEIKHQDKELNLRYVIFGGEALKPVKLKQWREKYPGTRLINMFGITETTVHVTYKEITGVEIESGISNIGKPIPTLSAFVMDGNYRLLPIGVAGELCVGGEGLGRGYLNMPALTAEKFIENPYIQGEKMYCSGDLAKLDKNFEMEYLGRIDNQVKIRGFRIELGEIESRLLKHEKIKKAAVISKEGRTGDKYLCAYIVSGEKFAVSDLREFLSKELPDYMVPHYFVLVDGFPLTLNGKIDWKALPEPGDAAVGSDIEFAAPRNDIEKKLLEIWQHVLGRDIIGINDNFFQLGGDSIKAIQIVARMNKLGYKLEMRNIFQNSRISELAPLAKKTERIADQSGITGIVPLTPVQEWFFQDNPIDSHHFNQAVMLYAEERFEWEAVEAIFTELQKHHDALRMTFKKFAGKIIQTNHGLEYPLSLEEYDLRAQDNALEILEQKVNKTQAGIHLEKGPLMKVGLFHLDDGDRLLIVIHHLVVDGVSWRILLDDIERLYRHYKKGESLELPLKTDSYKGWAEKLYEYADSPSFLEERTYWAGVESTKIEPITKDFEEKDNYVKDVDTVSFHLEREHTDLLLTRVNFAFGTEINDILLTALGAAIRKTWGHDRCLIALEGHGREEILKDIDISRTIGWFTSVYPVILDMSYEDDLSRQIKEVKECLRRVPHKGVGYGILKYLTAGEYKRAIGFGLNPQVSFNYLGQFDADLEGKSFKVAEEGAGRSQSPKMQRKYELDVFGMISNNRLNLAVAFNKKQYEKKTIETLLSYYQTGLMRIISYCTARKEKEYTPSDFSYKKLSVEILDRLSAQYGNAIEDIYPLTPMQEGMLFHTLYEKDGTAYFEQTSYRLHGDLDVGIVKKSYNELFKRYDILRTAFIYEGKGIECPLQLVLKEREIEFLYEDLRGLGVENGKDKGEVFIREFKEKERRRSFDLGKDVLMRLAILQADDREYEFVWSHHHILMDGWCTGILIAEFFEIYNSYLGSRPYRLSAVQPYRIYIQWLEKRDKDESGRYWRKYLEDYSQLVGIPKIGPAHPGKDYANERASFRLEKEETGSLNRLAARYHVTLNTVIRAVWGIILARYNGSCNVDVVFGAVVSGRPHEIENVESMVGLFINTIPVRVRCEAKTPFNRLLQQVQNEAVEGELHHYYPLAEIQSAHALKQNLLDHILIFENYPIAEQIDGIMSKENQDKQRLKWQLSNIDGFEQTNYDFNLVVGPGEQLQVIFSYNANVYEGDLIKKIARNVKRVLEQVINNPGTRVETISFLSEEEKRRILVEFNNTGTDYPKDKTIHQLFEEQVERTPYHIAAVGNAGETALTYRELSKRSNQLAHVLNEKGIQPDGVVGLRLERSIKVIIGILGVLKAGGAYLPIDPAYPEDRVNYMIADSAAKILLTSDAINRCFVPTPDDLHHAPCAMRYANTLAYIIYTSGTTGRPKGVMVQHQSLVNYIHWAAKNYVKNEPVNFPLYTSIAFDLTATSIFTPLVTGNAVVVYGGRDKGDLIFQIIDDNKVDAVKLTPSHLYLIQEKKVGSGNPGKSRIKRFIVGGEILDSQLAAGIHERFNGNIEIYNEYGPTEAAVGCMLYRFNSRRDKWKSVPIGTPAANTHIYLLDKNLEPVPTGAIGEIYISGIGLARGYVNNPGLTNKKFLRGGAPPARRRQIYKTGDLARWLPDGDIEFLGRIDDQVKIRGYRIELKEIENQLLTHSEIKAAVVIPGETPEGNKEEYLCAYLVTGKEFEVSELKDYLSKRLPNYMIPSYFIKVDKVPLTTSGKVDRKALLGSGAAVGTGVEYVAPENDLEKVIAGAWKEVLKLDKVGIHDNFFDIGGDSLKAIRLNSRLNEALSKKLSIVLLFEHVTIHSFVRYLNREKVSMGVSEQRADRSEVIDKVRKTRVDRKMKRRWGNINV